MVTELYNPYFCLSIEKVDSCSFPSWKYLPIACSAIFISLNCTMYRHVQLHFFRILEVLLSYPQSYPSTHFVVREHYYCISINLLIQMHLYPHSVIVLLYSFNWQFQIESHTMLCIIFYHQKSQLRTQSFLHSILLIRIKDCNSNFRVFLMDCFDES